MDFNKQYPNISITFIKSNNMIHDRFIVVDYNTKNETTYHLGSSIKDSGNKITAINKFNNSTILHETIKLLLKNPQLIIN